MKHPYRLCPCNGNTNPLIFASHLPTSLAAGVPSCVGRRRRACDRLSVMVKTSNTISQKQSDQLPLIRDYKSKIETELTDICDDILKIIESELIPNSTSEEGKVFYYKMKGDYHR